ncbi:BrnT family toxin [Thiocapsa rosea]
MFGRSQGGRYLVVSFTERAEIIRIISARRMTPTERKAYEE